MAKIRRVKNVNVVDGIEFVTITKFIRDKLYSRATFAPVEGYTDLGLISYWDGEETRDVQYQPNGVREGLVYCDTLDGVILRVRQLTDTLKVPDKKFTVYTFHQAEWLLLRSDVEQIIRRAVARYKKSSKKGRDFSECISNLLWLLCIDFDATPGRYYEENDYRPRFAKEPLELDPLIVDHYKHGLFIKGSIKPSTWLDEQAKIIIDCISQYL